MKKFDFVIGNPPYQDSTSVNNRAGAIYPEFYNAAEKISDRYLLISPARFLFNTGLTSKEWNQKMLSDEHIKIEDYVQDSSLVFSNTDIKGGIVVLYRDLSKDFGAIEEFISDETLRKISKHFTKDSTTNLPSIMYGGRSDMKFNDKFLEDHPNVKDVLLKNIQRKHPNVTKLSPNEEYEIKSSTFKTLGEFLLDKKPKNEKDYYKILGLLDGKRTYKWINKKYLTPRYLEDNNVNKFKVFVPESNGSGAIGEVLSTPVIGTPVIGTPVMTSTPTFISIGKFDTLEEAQNLEKYLRCKLTRLLLGIKKTTQHNPPELWKYIPLQDFTSKSDIDWSKSISDIDKQLYKKYKLSKEEIDFIESHVKEMD